MKELKSAGAAGTVIVSNVNNYNKSSNMFGYICDKYEKRCCKYDRLKILFILSDRYHIRKHGNTISNSRMYEYNYFLTLLKKYIEKSPNFILKDGVLTHTSSIPQNVFNANEIETLDTVFDLFKKYNNNQIQRYFKQNIGLIKYCTQFFNNIDDEYCNVSQHTLESNINIYNSLCDYLDERNHGKSIRNERIYE